MVFDCRLVAVSSVLTTLRFVRDFWSLLILNNVVLVHNNSHTRLVVSPHYTSFRSFYKDVTPHYTSFRSFKFTH